MPEEVDVQIGDDTRIADIAAKVPRVPADKYRILFELGRGGMGSVFLAVVQGPAGFNKLQVLKILKSELSSDPTFLNMFLEEARLSARIIHPNVAQTQEVGFDGTHYFIAMEYLAGQSLHAVSRRDEELKKLPLDMHVRILAEVLSGLHHAHELTDFSGVPLSVVHRDVSPQNVFITYDGSIKILDFGIAKAADSSQETRTGVIKGKVAYMAPEQFKGKVDRRVDVYAAGAILWQALTGQRLWKGMSDVEIYTELNGAGVPKPSSVANDVPPELEAICMKALAFRADDRFATAADMQAALESHLQAKGAHVSARDVGQAVASMFADRRREVREAIDRRIKALETGRTGEIPAASSPSGANPVAPRLTNSGATPQVTLTDHAGPTATEVAPPFAEKKKKMVMLAGGVAVVGVALAAIGIASSGSHEPAPSAAASASSPSVAVSSVPAVSSAAPSASASAATAPALTQLNVSAQPPAAKIFIDDVSVTNPTTMKFPRDGKEHAVRAEANGFARHDEQVVFSEPTVTVKIVLTKSGKKSSPSTASTPTAAAAATTTAQPAGPPATAAPTATAKAAPTTTNKKKDSLDSADPWSKPGH